MVSVNARKWGLIVSLTRFVHFGRVPDDLKEKYRANVFIDCVFMAATQPGRPRARFSREASRLTRRKGSPRSGSCIIRGIHRLYGQGLQDQLQHSGHDPGKPGFYLEPLLDGNEVGGHDPCKFEGVEMITRPCPIRLLP